MISIPRLTLQIKKKKPKTGYKIKIQPHIPCYEQNCARYLIETGYRCQKSLHIPHRHKVSCAKSDSFQFIKRCHSHFAELHAHVALLRYASSPEIQPFVSKLPRLIFGLSAHRS